MCIRDRLRGTFTTSTELYGTLLWSIVIFGDKFRHLSFSTSSVRLFDGLDSSLNLVWHLPQLQLYAAAFCFGNSAKPAEDNEVTPESNYVFIYNDGRCIWEPRYELSIVRCPVDETWFPFDDQNCQLNFVSWLLKDDQLKLSVDHLYKLQPGYTESEQWIFVGK